MAKEALIGKITELDYGVFVLSIVATAAIGFVYACKDRKRGGMENFHRGNKQINPAAVTFSIAVTNTSSLIIVGVTSEIYSFGTMAMWSILAQVIGTAVAAHMFLPVFYQMDKISIFQFFERRFGKLARTFCSSLVLLNSTILMGLVVYAPALSISAVTDISILILMAAISVVCMSYTIFGGMKAVVWADVLQCAVMFAGLICLLVEGSKAMGGLDNAWSIANRYGRIQFDNFDFDPRTRHTVWTLVIGHISQYSYVIGTNQLTMQRACSLPTLKSAKLAVWFTFPVMFLMAALNMLIGVVTFAYYHTCDPVASNRITRTDQLFSLMIVDTLGYLPGLPGLLLACLCSAALSTISSAYSALSAIIVEDFVRPNSPQMSDKSLLILSKIAVVGIGSVVIGVGCLFSKLQGLLAQLIFTITSIIGGPLFAFFLVCVLFPWINTSGIIAGFIASLSLSGWLIFGALFNMPPPTPLPVSVEGCTTIYSGPNTTTVKTMNTTLLLPTTTAMYTDIQMDEESHWINEFYKLSYMLYHLFGVTVFVLVSLCVSFLTGPRDPRTVDSKLMSPLFYNVCPFLPEKYRCKLLFGVNYDYEYTRRVDLIKSPSDETPRFEENTSSRTTRL